MTRCMIQYTAMKPRQQSWGHAPAMFGWHIKTYCEGLNRENLMKNDLLPACFLEKILYDKLQKFNFAWPYH